MTSTFKLYACIAFGAVIGFIVWNSHRIERKNEELCRTIAAMEQAGKNAADAAKKKEREHEETVKALEARYSADLVALRADNQRLREYRPTVASAMPVAAPGARCPAEWACFDRTELSAALDGFVQDAAGIAEEGSEDRLRLAMAIDYIRQLIKEG